MPEQMNRNVSQDQFRYVTNMKGKPNSQGTLFQVNPNQRTPESRQPRGYSPERYKAVTEATGIKVQNTRGKSWMGHPHGGARMMIYPGHAETLARAAASLARSTVPMSDITRPDPSHPASERNPDLNIGIHDKTPEETGELGHYSRPRSTAMTHQGRIAIMKGANGDDTTVLHEIGHHVDRANPYGTASERGRAEGFAEAYAQKHARTPGYKKKPITITPKPEKWSSHLSSWNLSPHQFEQAFYSEHPRASGPVMNSKEEILSRPGIPKGHVIGQLPLLHYSSGLDNTNPRWTYNEDLRR